jgi:hypothetical protein
MTKLEHRAWCAMQNKKSAVEKTEVQTAVTTARRGKAANQVNEQ